MSNFAYDAWEKDFLEIDKKLSEAEETNQIYNLKSQEEEVIDIENQGVTVVSNDGQEIPKANTSSTNTSVVHIPQGQVIKELRSQSLELSEQTKKNLMIFGAGLALFLVLKRK